MLDTEYTKVAQYRTAVLTLGNASWLNSSWRFLTVLNTRVLQANGSQRIIERSLGGTGSECIYTLDRFVQYTVSSDGLFYAMLSPVCMCISYPNTCSCPFFTPSRNPCNSRARLASTNFSLMQASKHQENYKRERDVFNIKLCPLKKQELIYCCCLLKPCQSKFRVFQDFFF